MIRTRTLLFTVTLKANDDGLAQPLISLITLEMWLELPLECRVRLDLDVVGVFFGVDDDGVLLPEQVGRVPRLLRRNTATAVVQYYPCSACSARYRYGCLQLKGWRADQTARGQYDINEGGWLHLYREESEWLCSPESTERVS